MLALLKEQDNLLLQHTAGRPLFLVGGNIMVCLPFSLLSLPPLRLTFHFSHTTHTKKCPMHMISSSLSNAQCSSGIISPWYAHLLSSSSLILHDWSLPAYLHHTAVGALSPPLLGLRPIIYKKNNNTSSTTHVTLRRPLFS